MPTAMDESLEPRPHWLTLAHLPLFGRSRAYMVETLNAWLARFAPTPPRA